MAKKKLYRPMTKEEKRRQTEDTIDAYIALIAGLIAFVLLACKGEVGLGLYFATLGILCGIFRIRHTDMIRIEDNEK